MILQIVKEKAQEAFNKADATGKALLVNLLGKEHFKPANPLEWVNSFADVCEAAGMKEDDYTIDSSMSLKLQLERQESRLDLIGEVFNMGWMPDLADTSQYKYYPWFNIVKDSSSPSGFRLSFFDSNCDYVSSGLGARLYLKDEATSIYVGKTFLSEFERYAQIKNEIFKSKIK